MPFNKLDSVIYETYLHKPLKILQFPSRGKIPKMFNITWKYFSIFNNKLPASWVAHVTSDFLTCYFCSCYNSMDWCISRISHDISRFLFFPLVSRFYCKTQCLFCIFRFLKDFRWFAYRDLNLVSLMPY